MSDDAMSANQGAITDSTASDDNGSGDEDNTGIEDEFTAFWDQADEEKEQTTTPAAGAPVANPADVVNQVLESVDFGDFSHDELRQLEQGDFSPMNSRIVKAGRVAMQQTLLLSARMMQAQKEQMLQEIEAQLDERIGKFKQDSHFEEEIPFARDPAIRPIARGIFDMALKRANGDAKKAAEMTKQFMSHLSGKLGDSAEQGKLPATRNAARSRGIQQKEFDFMAFLQNG